MLNVKGTDYLIVLDENADDDDSVDSNSSVVYWNA